VELTPTIIALRIAGVLLLATAFVRVAISAFQSFHAHGSAAHLDFAVRFSTDYLTLSAVVAGVLLCVLGFGAGKKRP
jgi:hypothetical protein